MFKEEYDEETARGYVQNLADDLNGKFNHIVEDVRALVAEALAYFGPIKRML